MANDFIFNNPTDPIYTVEYGTATNNRFLPLIANKSGSLIVDPSVTLANSREIMFSADSGVVSISYVSDVVAIKVTNPSNSGVYMVVSSVTISSYDTSINARFSFHPTFLGGTHSTLIPVSNNSGSSANSNILAELNYGTVATSNELVIANILFPTSVTTFQIQGSIIVAPNTSAGFRGIAISKNTHITLNVSWLEIPSALFY